MTLLDDAPASPDPPFPAAAPPRLQRAIGEARASVGPVPRGPRTRTAIRRLHQAGCLKLPLSASGGGECQAVIINTSGGLTGGDRLTLGFEVEPRGALTVTTQACERVYRSTGGRGRRRPVDAAGIGGVARLPAAGDDPLRGRRLSRRLTLDAAADSRFLLLESVNPRPRGEGETVADGLIADRWRVRRNGRLFWPKTSVSGATSRRSGGRARRSTALAPFDAGLAVAGRRRLLAGLRAGLGPTEGASLVDGPPRGAYRGGGRYA